MVDTEIDQRLIYGSHSCINPPHTTCNEHMSCVSMFLRVTFPFTWSFAVNLKARDISHVLKPSLFRRDPLQLIRVEILCSANAVGQWLERPVRLSKPCLNRHVFAVPVFNLGGRPEIPPRLPTVRSTLIFGSRVSLCFSGRSRRTWAPLKPHAKAPRRVDRVASIVAAVPSALPALFRAPSVVVLVSGVITQGRHTHAFTCVWDPVVGSRHRV